MSAKRALRKRKWTDDEIKLLIQLWKEKQRDVMRIKHCRVIMEKISEEMQMYSIIRNSTEIRKKITALKKMYRDEKKAQENIGGCPSKWRFFNAINEILDSVPNEGSVEGSEADLNQSVIECDNGNSGDIRSGSDVKRKWQDIKCRVKTKVIQIASQKNSTESGSRKPIQLTPLEKRVHAISQRTSLPIPSIESITGARARKKIVIEKNAAFKELGTDCKSMDSEDQSQFLDCASDSTFEKHNMSRASLIDQPETTKQNFSSKEKVSSPDMHHVHKRKFVAAEDNSEESESLSIDDIKELKQEIRKLREAVESVVNIEKMNLQLKCHKYGITVVQLSDK